MSNLQVDVPSCEVFIMCPGGQDHPKTNVLNHILSVYKVGSWWLIMVQHEEQRTTSIQLPTKKLSLITWICPTICLTHFVLLFVTNKMLSNAMVTDQRGSQEKSAHHQVWPGNWCHICSENGLGSSSPTAPEDRGCPNSTTGSSSSEDSFHHHAADVSIENWSSGEKDSHGPLVTNWVTPKVIDWLVIHEPLLKVVDWWQWLQCNKQRWLDQKGTPLVDCLKMVYPSIHEHMAMSTTGETHGFVGLHIGNVLLCNSKAQRLNSHHHGRVSG